MIQTWLLTASRRFVIGEFRFRNRTVIIGIDAAKNRAVITMRNLMLLKLG
jgi:hypothetical protein